MDTQATTTTAVCEWMDRFKWNGAKGHLGLVVPVHFAIEAVALVAGLDLDLGLDHLVDLGVAIMDNLVNLILKSELLFVRLWFDGLSVCPQV